MAAYLKQSGISVEIIDCTFIKQEEALRRIIDSKPKIIGIQSMYSMKEKSLELAEVLKAHCELLVAGGALPTTEPDTFLEKFDVAVIGEGEQTMLELVNQFINGGDFSEVKGIVYHEKNTGQIKHTPQRGLNGDLNTFPNPSREFLITIYKNIILKVYYTTTVVIVRVIFL
jgi:radical SAM superfamily enzyme YgiQ (UPF0313 family)